MGCVLAKGASGKREDHRRKKTDERRYSETTGGGERGKEKKIEDVPAAAVVEFRLKRGVSTGCEGWPSWLNDVAGHAIKDWKPRRASTFEKIDKVKCYMKQLLSGLEHCHNNGVLHRDIKCSNLLIDNDGILRIADFGLASFFNPESKRPMTSRVVTLWYRPPELLLGATHYGVGVDLWSAGCILAELFAGKPILRGRTEVEQLHKIFKLCGSPPEEYWKKSRLPNATLYKPQRPYRCCLAETFKDFPPCTLDLIETLLTIDPDGRGSATEALNSEFFTTEPFACERSSLPTFPPSKEMDIKLRDEAARRQRGLGAKPQAIDGNKQTRSRVSGSVPVPEANAELQPNLDRLRMIWDAKSKSKSDKFRAPHEDASPDGSAISFSAADTSSFASIFDRRSSRSITSKSTTLRSRNDKEEPHPQRARARSFMNALYPSSIVWDFGFTRRPHLPTIEGRD